jgi:hypothetical protein
MEKIMKYYINDHEEILLEQDISQETRDTLIPIYLRYPFSANVPGSLSPVTVIGYNKFYNMWHVTFQNTTTTNPEALRIHLYKAVYFLPQENVLPDWLVKEKETDCPIITFRDRKILLIEFFGRINMTHIPEQEYQGYKKERFRANQKIITNEFVGWIFCDNTVIYLNFKDDYMYLINPEERSYICSPVEKKLVNQIKYVLL